VIAKALGMGGQVIGGATKAATKTAPPSFLEKIMARVRSGCPIPVRNSFAPTTKVTTALGFTAIASLAIGTPVLAFNEQTGDTGYYPITQTHKNQDEAITYLNISDETIETTPNHPFYVSKPVDNTKRPTIKGHEDLSQRWVGAGDLKVGDQIKQAGGKDGTVNFVQTLAKPATMYNLTVAQAHTYYVGSGQWLVHNGPQLSAVDRRVLAEATRFLKPEVLQKIEKAFASGQFTEIMINNRPVSIDPMNPYHYSGFTNFQTGGFSLGPAAIESPEELRKSILHELHRLNTSQAATGISQEIAAGETKAAQSWADRMFDYLYPCGVKK
jgi:hypothetical protein